MTRAFIVAIVLSVLFATSAVAQGPSNGIQATGIGTASAPAQTAHLQILLGSSAFFGMGPVEMAPGTPSIDLPPVGPMGQVSLSDEQLGPVIDVITGAGVGEDAIEVTLPASSSPFGPGGPETAEIRATIDQPQGEDLAVLVAAIHATAPNSGLTVLHVGARFEAADCAALMQQARDAAIADANQRAEGLALGLGVTLGEIVQASESPYFGPTGTDSCAPAGTVGDFGPYGPGTDPAFDPDATEATVTVQVTLTYAIATAT
jgi:uncharacterized protein YggE